MSTSRTLLQPPASACSPPSFAAISATTWPPRSATSGATCSRREAPWQRFVCGGTRSAASSTTAPREHLDLLRGDIRYALRNLRRNPGFTIVAVLALAVGIGANTAVFTIVNGVLLRALPYRHPGELVTMFEKVPGAPVDKFGFSAPDFEIVRDAARSYTGHVRVPQRDGRVVRRWGIPARRRDAGLARDVRRARRRTDRRAAR